MPIRSYHALSCRPNVLCCAVQYDWAKKMERMGKSVALMGQAEPTIIQPSQYRKRFYGAMERYFMTVPDKWTQHDV